MSSNSDSEVKERLNSTVREIVLISEKWCRYLEQQRKTNMQLNALLFGISILLLLISIGILLQNVPLILSAIFASALSNICFYLLEKTQKPSYLELFEALRNVSTGKSQNLSEAMLHLLDKMTLILPEVKKNKQYEAISWGVLAGILMFLLMFFSLLLSVVLLLLLSSLTVGIITWVYTRDRAIREYRQEVVRFKKIRKSFEEQKKDFMKSL